MVTDEQLARLTEVSHFVSEVANMTPWPQQPYVGASAFAHKAGYHTDRVIKVESAYQHIDPAVVGNHARLLVSELGGSRGLLDKLGELGIDHPLSRDDARALTEQIKEMEARGYQYEGADASLELLVRRSLPGYKPPFNLDDFWVVERRRDAPTRRPRPRDAGRGDGQGARLRPRRRGPGDPDGGRRQRPGERPRRRGAQRRWASSTRRSAIRLVDYKVRIIDTAAGTGASVRVLIESSDGDRLASTVGASTDIIEASWLALNDALEYWLLKHAGE